MRRPPRPTSWGTALVLVASIHLLTTPGTWCFTDQAEALYTARRLITHGTFELAPSGESRLEEVPWVLATPGQPVRSRLLPGTAVTLAPLLLLDRLLGWERPVQYGTLVHLQGHLLVWASLALLGWSVRVSGGTAQAAAMAVALTGLSWPFWRASLSGGSEPVMGFLVGVFLAGAAIERHRAGGRRGGGLLQASACALLPWANPEGTILGAGLLAAAVLERVAPRRATGSEAEQPRLLWPLAAATLAGNAGVVWLWNHLYQGNWWAGGYAAYDVVRFGEIDPFRGLWIYGQGALLQLPVLLIAAGCAARAGAAGLHALILPATLTAAVLAAFSTHFWPEPARRLAAVCPAWGAALGRSWDAVRWRPGAAQALLAACSLVGFYWFMAERGRHYAGPRGLFYPWVVWVKLAIDGRPWAAALPVLALLALAAIAAGRVGRMLRTA